MKLPKIALFCILFSFFLTSSVFAANQPTTAYLSEFAANPEVDSEWVELYNPTVTSVDLSNWQIDDIEGGSNPFLIPDGLIIASSEYKVFEIGTKLNNTGDSLRLLDSNGVIVDQFDYSSATKGYSWARNNNYEWQETMEQTPGEVNVIVTPTPTPAPTATPTLSPTPTITSTPTPTPTPQITLVISFSPPAEVQVDQPFSISVTVSNTNANSSYYLKALIGETNNPSEMYEGKTKSEDRQSFLAWNASWNKMPILQTNASGTGERTIEIKVDDDIVAGNYFLVIRIRKTDTTTNFDSGAKSFNVTALESEEPVTTESTEEPMEDTEEPATTENTEEFVEGTETIFIAEAREMEDGKIVMIEGAVTAEPELLGSKAMWIEDESGGIKVLLDEKNRSDIKLGGLVKITGKLGESFNERYIKMVSLEFLGQGDLPEALLVKMGGVDEEYEGELVLVNGQVTETSGAVFYLDDGSGEIKVYIKSSTRIEKPKMRKGYYSEVRGICSQHSDDYRILPRYQDDILVSQNPIEKGSVLGTVTSLPETGFHISDFGLLSLGIGLILRRLLE